ncbi:MAG: OmpA family protein [Deltaproteobacteria bacterium]|nr:OmpA family protein [Deltaproteobacteria bacterium]
MRSLVRLAALLALALPTAATAQFDDEFDDEFEEEPAEEAPAEQPPSSGGGFDDEFADDAFPEESESESASESASESESESESASESESESEDEGPIMTAEEVQAAIADWEPPPPDPADERRLRLMPTLAGASGGFRLADARPGAAGTWRMQLAVGYFKKDGFLEEGDDHDTVNASLSAAWSPIDLLELYLGIHSQAAFNRADFPPLIMALGDFTLGAKVGAELSPIFSVGGDVRFELPTGGGVGVGFEGMGVGLRAMGTADLRGRDEPLPLVFRGVLGYTFDRTERLIDGVEQRRYDALGDDALPIEQESRHLINRVERFGLGVNRTDFLHIGLGMEAPIELPKETTLAPLLEYRWDIPVNRQGYVCPFVDAEGEDSCLDQQGASSHPMSLTLGARARMPSSGVQATFAIDIGMTGRKASQVVRELAANAPWRIWLGVGYTFDPRDPPPAPVFRQARDVEVEVGPEPPVEGRVIGRLLERGTTYPVPNGIVNFVDRTETSLRATEQGTFTSYRFTPGPVTMLALAPGFMPANCETAIPEEGGDVEVVCELQRALVEVEEDRVVILEKIQFAHDSAEILEASFGLMQQIADALRDNPDIAVVEIQGHTDDTGTHAYNAQLSQQRAESVEAWLTEHGIAESRLRARGYGETVPLVNEPTDEARARNRRVEFRILQHSGR